MYIYIYMYTLYIYIYKVYIIYVYFIYVSQNSSIILLWEVGVILLSVSSICLFMLNTIKPQFKVISNHALGIKLFPKQIWQAASV